MPVDERLVIAGEELVRVNRRIAELLQSNKAVLSRANALQGFLNTHIDFLADSRRRLKAMAKDRDECQRKLTESMEPAGRAERWYRDVAAEHLRATARLPRKTQHKRLARLLKHMAYQPERERG